MMALKAGFFHYREAIVASTLTDAANKCRALFNCRQEEMDGAKEEKEPSDVARVDFNKPFSRGGVGVEV